MRIKPNDIKVPADNPFKHDTLDRRESVEILVRLKVITRIQLFKQCMGQSAQGIIGVVGVPRIDFNNLEL